MIVNSAAYANTIDRHYKDQSATSATNKNGVDSSVESEASVVDISEEARKASASSEPPTKFVMLDSFGSPAHRIPPQPSSALEEMIYHRGSQTIDFTQTPARWPSNNEVLDYDKWLEYEKELDKQTDDRIKIYEQSMLAGLSKEEIIKEIDKYNSTLHPRYIHRTEVEKRTIDIERPPFKLPPSGSYTDNIMNKRAESFQIMVKGMSKNPAMINMYMS